MEPANIGHDDYEIVYFKGDDNQTRPCLVGFNDKGGSSMVLTLWGEDSSNQWTSFLEEIRLTPTGPFAACGRAKYYWPCRNVSVKLNSTEDGKGLYL